MFDQSDIAVVYSHSKVVEMRYCLHIILFFKLCFIIIIYATKQKTTHENMGKKQKDYIALFVFFLV